MANDEEQILDRFDDEPESHWTRHWTILYIPVLIFIGGLVLRISGLTIATLVIGIALILILLRSLVYFFSKRRKADEWFYFLGRIALISALIVFFIGKPYAAGIIYAGLILYGAGILFSLISSRKKPREQTAIDEDI